MAMNRADWQHLAEERVRDALGLLSLGQWSGAYYIVGYAVEFGLKSCILVRLATAPELIFDEKRFSEKCWTHNLEELVALAGLKTIFEADRDANPALDAYWRTVKAWSERDRFRLKTESQARELVEAITNNANGVLQWIRGHW